MQRKATFIDQVMRGDIAGRSVDDIGDAAVSYAEVKALATGNPLIMERAGVASDLVRLERQLAAYNRDQAALVRTHASAERRASHAWASADAYRAVDARRQPTAGDRFSMTVAGTCHVKRADAASALQEELTCRLDHLALGARSTAVVGRLGGIDVELSATRDTGGAYGELGFSGLPGWVANFTRGELRALAPIGLISRLEHRLNGLAERAAESDDDADRARTEAARAAGRIGAGFDQMARIDDLRGRLADIDAALAPLEENDPPPTEPAGVRTVAYQDLPFDVQGRIAELTGRHDLDGSTLEVFPVEVARFPDVPIGEDSGDTRTPAEYRDVALSASAPTLLLGEYWLAGRPVVAHARAHHITTIDAIDLTALVAEHFAEDLQGANLGRLTRSTAQQLADRTPADQAQSGSTADGPYADAPGGGMPRWPKRQSRERSGRNDIGL